LRRIFSLSLAKSLIEFLVSLPAAVAVLLLDQTDHLVGLNTRLFQVIVGELAPPYFGLSRISLSLAFKYVLYPPETYQNELPTRVTFLNPS
jgi:hypothetical protein